MSACAGGGGASLLLRTMRVEEKEDVWERQHQSVCFGKRHAQPRFPPLVCLTLINYIRISFSNSFLRDLARESKKILSLKLVLLRRLCSLAAIYSTFETSANCQTVPVSAESELPFRGGR